MPNDLTLRVLWYGLTIEPSKNLSFYRPCERSAEGAIGRGNHRAQLSRIADIRTLLVGNHNSQISYTMVQNDATEFAMHNRSLIRNYDFNKPPGNLGAIDQVQYVRVWLHCLETVAKEIGDWRRPSTFS